MEPIRASEGGTWRVFWRAWPFIPLILLPLSLLGGGDGIVGMLVFLFFLPTHLLWCGIGAVGSLANDRSDRATLFINLGCALPGALLFLGHATNALRFHI